MFDFTLFFQILYLCLQIIDELWKSSLGKELRDWYNKNPMGKKAAREEITKLYLS
jgi:hypothetical protein